MDKQTFSVFLSGDVMTGRGVDQILTHPSNPEIFESYVKDATEYVRLAEHYNGPIPRSNPGSYIWGDALKELESRSPEDSSWQIMRFSGLLNSSIEQTSHLQGARPHPVSLVLQIDVLHLVLFPSVSYGLILEGLLHSVE